jgi:hypothetical protein
VSSASIVPSPSVSFGSAGIPTSSASSIPSPSESALEVLVPRPVSVVLDSRSASVSVSVPSIFTLSKTRSNGSVETSAFPLS